MTPHRPRTPLRSLAFVSALLALASLLACGEGGDGWRTSTPAAEGMNAALLEQARTYAFAEGKNTQGVVIVRHGRIIAEWYAEGASVDSYAASWSMGKSFTSALVGIALEEGSIPSLDVSMADYIPSWVGTERATITLRDVLEMSSGLDWDETYGFGSDVQTMVFATNGNLPVPVGRPLAHTPGTVFNYSSGDTMLLSAVLQAATGMSVAEYAQQKLFGPLGIRNADWWKDTTGMTLTYCCVDVRSRDFARFGELYLRHGAWNGRSIVPAAWVDASLAPSRSYVGYGLQWWLIGRETSALPLDTFAAIGHDGQYIYVIPSRDLVVVRNGTYVKFDGEPVADPSLFARYPSDDLVPRHGTKPPDEWDDVTFLSPILDSISGD